MLTVRYHMKVEILRHLLQNMQHFAAYKIVDGHIMYFVFSISIIGHQMS